DGGASITFNGGATWSTLDNQPTGQFYAVTTDSGVPYRVYGSQQDNTSVSIASRTNGAGITTSDWHPVAGGESGYLAPTPSNPPDVYGGSYFGLMTRYDGRTGEARNVTIWPDYNGGRTAAQVKYRFQWTYPIIISPHDGNTVYAAAQVVFRSTNGGQSWETISPDLTRNDKAKQEGGRLEEYYSTIFTIAESRREKSLIWAGSDDGLVHVTRNGGRDWHNVTPSAMPPYTRVNIIEASPHDAGTAYLAVNRHQLDDYRPYVFKTTDFGKSWQSIGSGIPERSFVRTIREDPKRKELNLPVVPITDLAIRNDDLVASTQGRGFWILDDLTPLHASGDPTSPGTRLFPPRDAVRTRRGFGRGGRGVGENPPGGAIITYSLESAQPVTLEFLDQRGTVVRAVSSTDRNGPAATAGMHRYAWDMRYTDAHGIDGGTFLAGGNLRGPLAVPGNYQVRLTAGGQTLLEPLRIVTDPTSKGATNDLEKQFELLMAIRDKVSMVHDTANEITGTRARLSARGDRATFAELDAALERLSRELVEPRFAGFDDQMLVFDLKLNNRMAALQGYVAQGDYAPTDQQLAVFKELSAAIDETLSRYEGLKARVPR
ncbi:MAG: glycosyl hydrolase, partial [Acidobacteria bacterium]|nr:glycosyl hydrolase [Acidobacteriota bacterium]